MDRKTVGLKLQDEKIQFEIKHIRYKLYGKDTKKRFNEILPHAIDITERLLHDPFTKPSTKFQAAQEIMDRALGKPKQTIDHEGSLIRSLFDKLDGKGEPVEVDVITVTEEQTMLPLPEKKENPNGIINLDTENPNLKLDPVDQWVKDNL